MPHLPENVSVIIIKKQGQNHNNKDFKVTASNSLISDFNGEVPDPHPCAKDCSELTANDFNDVDYESLINCFQRHVCRLGGYCKNKLNSLLCRFGYPIQIRDKTIITFTETKSCIKASLFLKRNDSQMNIHNRLLCHHWRANMDIQIILDHSAAINYMVKYATKGSIIKIF